MVSVVHGGELLASWQPGGRARRREGSRNRDVLPGHAPSHLLPPAGSHLPKTTTSQRSIQLRPHQWMIHGGGQSPHDPTMFKSPTSRHCCTQALNTGDSGDISYSLAVGVRQVRCWVTGCACFGFATHGQVKNMALLVCQRGRLTEQCHVGPGIPATATSHQPAEPQACKQVQPMSAESLGNLKPPAGV